MAGKKYYDYAALATGTSFGNADTANAAAIGATTTAVSNGTLTIVAASLFGGSTKCLEGNTQGTSGTSYIAETVSPSMVGSFSVFWVMPALGAIGFGPVFIGNAGTRIVAMTMLSNEQIRFFDASGGTLGTTSFAGGFAAGTIYRTDFNTTVATATTGVFQAETFLATGTVGLTGTLISQGACDLGTLPITNIRHGIRSATGTADDGIRVAMGYDLTAAYQMGPWQAPIQPPGVRMQLRTQAPSVSAGVLIPSTGQTVRMALRTKAPSIIIGAGAPVSTTGTVLDNKHRVLLAANPALTYPTMSNLFVKYQKDYLTAQAVSIPAQSSSSDISRLYYAQKCVQAGVFADLTAARGYSVGDLKKRMLVAWATAQAIPTANKSASDLELAYWRSL